MARNLSLKYKLILGGFVAVFVPFFIAGIVIYTQLSDSLLSIAKEKSVYVAKDMAAAIESSLVQEIKLVSSVSSDPDIIQAAQTGDYRVAQTELDALFKRIGSKFFTIFLADKTGIIRADPQFNQQICVNIADRAYFLKAKEGQTFISGPMLPKGSATPDKPIIVVCVPIQDNGEFLGITAMAFDTDFIENILVRKKLGQTGYAYLINADGLVLVHPRKEFILKKRLLGQPGTEEMAKIIQSKQPGAALYSLEGSEHIVGLASVDSTGWIAAFSQGRAEIMTPVNDILVSIFLSGLVFLFGTILIIVVLSSKISHPINRMAEMMKQVTQHSTEVILQVGLDRKISYANPAFEKITGLKQEEVVGTEVGLENTNNIAPKTIWALIESGSPWSGRVVIEGKRPDPITLDVMLVPFINDRRVVQGYLEIGRDVSEELMFEKRLQQAQKLEAVGTLAGGVAHDFNNILSGILGYAELSLMKLEPGSETEKYIKQIMAASERARDLIKQILTFSAKTEVELVPLFPQAILRDALKLLRASIPATINIESELDCNSAIMAEPTQLHQIVMNLFTNAVHAIGPKTGTIKLELGDFWVDEEFIRTHPNIRPGPHVIIRVSDTGSGIDAKILDRMFEPFFTTKGPGHGTGLGLSVVHGIVNNWGGIITVYSELEKGTMFNIIIPTIEAGESLNQQKHPVITGGTERIAIIDDEPAITATLNSILTHLGYQVTAYTDSLDALMAIKADPSNFDLIITDYAMPNVTGLEIARDLYETGLAVPVILTSGYLDKKLEEEAQQVGISVWVTKPANIYQLTEAIHRALGQGDKQGRQALLDRLPACSDRLAVRF